MNAANIYLFEIIFTKCKYTYIQVFSNAFQTSKIFRLWFFIISFFFLRKLDFCCCNTFAAKIRISNTNVLFANIFSIFAIDNQAKTVLVDFYFPSSWTCPKYFRSWFNSSNTFFAKHNFSFPVHPTTSILMKANNRCLQ